MAVESSDPLQYAPVKLSSLLPVEQILLPVRGAAKSDVIGELLGVLPFRDAAARDAAAEAVLARERELSTGIGRGVAVPHARTDAVSAHLCAFGVSAEPVDFDAIDGRPCRLFFLCLSGEHDTAEHIRVLSQVARVLNNSETRKALETARRPEDVRQVFLDDEAREKL